jgi:hypothetical protein
VSAYTPATLPDISPDAWASFPVLPSALYGPTAQKLALVLVALADADWVTVVGDADLRRCLKCSSAALRRARCELAAGFCTVERGGGTRRTRYRLWSMARAMQEGTYAVIGVPAGPPVERVFGLSSSEGPER